MSADVFMQVGTLAIGSVGVCVAFPESLSQRSGRLNACPAEQRSRNQNQGRFT
jgi:hypothetical protein